MDLTRIEQTLQDQSNESSYKTPNLKQPILQVIPHASDSILEQSERICKIGMDENGLETTFSGNNISDLQQNSEFKVQDESYYQDRIINLIEENLDLKKSLQQKDIEHKALKERYQVLELKYESVKHLLDQQAALTNKQELASKENLLKLDKVQMQLIQQTQKYEEMLVKLSAAEKEIQQLTAEKQQLTLTQQEKDEGKSKESKNSEQDKQKEFQEESSQKANPNNSTFKGFINLLRSQSSEKCSNTNEKSSESQESLNYLNLKCKISE